MLTYSFLGQIILVFLVLFTDRVGAQSWELEEELKEELEEELEEEPGEELEEQQEEQLEEQLEEQQEEELEEELEEEPEEELEEQLEEEPEEELEEQLEEQLEEKPEEELEEEPEEEPEEELEEQQEEQLEKQLDSLMIIGTQKTFPYTKFTGIDKEKRPLLTSIHLELVEFEPDYLVSQLEGCTSLVFLTLRDTHWKQRTFTRKVDLPRLFSFELYLRNWDYTASSTEEILSFYFVYKSIAWNYNASNFVPSLGISSSIHILTTNRKVNLINYRDPDTRIRRVLTISHLPFDVSPYFEFDFLELKNTVLNVSNLWEIKRSLEMEDVKLTNGGMNEVLAKSEDAFSLELDLQEFTELETIDIAQLPLAVAGFGVTNAFLWTSVPGLIRDSLFNLKLKRCDLNATNFPAHPAMGYLELSKINFIEGDMSFLNRYYRLRLLRIDWMSNFDLSISSSSRRTMVQLEFSHTTLIQSSPFKFSQLETLLLNNSRLDSNALNNFYKTFRKIKELEIIGDFKYLSSILLESLKTSVGLIRISLRGDQRIRSDSQFKEVNEFLRNSSVPPFATLIWLHKRTTNKKFSWKFNGKSEHYTQNPYIRNLAIYSYTIPLFIICFVGIIGNLMSAIVLLTKEMRSSTSCILLGLTLCDSTILLTYILSVLYFGLKFIFMFWKFSIPELEFPIFWFQISKGSAQHMENLHSLFIYPLNKTAYSGSVYMTILVTLERYVAVCWPLRSKRILTMKKAILGTLFVLAAAIVLNMPRWLEAQTNTLEESDHFSETSSVNRVHPLGLGYRRVSGENSEIGWKINRNTVSTDLLLYTNYRTFYHGWIWVILMYGIPVPVLIGLNLKIWIQLKRRINNKDALTTSRTTRNEEELASLTRLLLCVATVFIICNIINGVVTLAILWKNPGDWEPADIEIFSCIPLIINSSVNFIIYCLMGKKFRGILIKMLRKYCIFNWKVIVPCRWCNRNVSTAVMPEGIQNNVVVSSL